MSYLVLARKWRPQVFEDVIGQEHVTRTIQNAIRLGRLAHAFLLTGVRGVGKTSTARILAKAVNCERGLTPEPCNVCGQCEAITRGQAVDVLEIDGASNTGVDDVRELREMVKYAPSQGRYKVYIIDEVHMLSTSAFNALLKTLEEPPPHVIFIFATTEAQKIPETIVSRCQRYDFRKIPTAAIAKQLADIASREGLDLSAAATALLARQADGSMRDGQSLLDQVIAYGGTSLQDSHVKEVLGVPDRQALLVMGQAVAQRDVAGCLDSLAEAIRQGHDLRLLADGLVQLFRDLVVLATCDRPQGLVEGSEEEIRELSDLAGRFERATLARLFDLVVQGAEQAIRSAYPETRLEMTLVRLCLVGAMLPNAEVLARLKRMEESLRSLGPSLADPQVGPRGEPPPEGRSPEAPSEPARPQTPPGRVPEDPFEVVEALMERLSREGQPLLAQIIQQGDIISWREGTLHLAFAKGSFAATQALSDSGKKMLIQVARSLFGDKLNIDLRALEANREGLGSLAARKRDDDADKQRLLRERIEAHPVVQEAKGLFEGRLEKVRTS